MYEILYVASFQDVDLYLARIQDVHLYLARIQDVHLNLALIQDVDTTLDRPAREASNWNLPKVSSENLFQEAHPRERIFIELMPSDRKLKASREGSK